jgi:hypothetical protein
MCTCAPFDLQLLPQPLRDHHTTFAGEENGMRLGSCLHDRNDSNCAIDPPRLRTRMGWGRPAPAGSGPLNDSPFIRPNPDCWQIPAAV